MSEKLSDEEIEIYRKVGSLTAEVREEAKSMVEPGQKLLIIAEKVEEMIDDRGAVPAFPCNISLNERAAHYTPPEEDDNEIGEGDFVKIDIGAHIDGYIADTAVTVCASEDEDKGENEGEMIQVVNQILEDAIKLVKPGIDVGEIGGLVERTAEEHGYKPISNLTGHKLERWSLHGGVSIPNVEKETGDKLGEGDVIALEPFITDGKGEVEDLPEVYIFRYLGNKGVSGRMALKTLRKIQSKYGGLPFAERWLAKDLSRIRLQMTLRELLTTESLHPYYVLKEVEDGQIAQAEHTMIVTEDGCEVTTR